MERLTRRGTDGLLTRAAALAVAVVAVLLLSPSQALADHVSCGDTITKDTKLDSDLIGCPGNGLVIGADDITLDLNGHTLKADGSFARDTAGIDNTSGYDRVTIERGVIELFEYGILMQGADRNVLRGNTIYVDVGGIMGSGDRNRLIHNIVGTAFDGISFDGEGTGSRPIPSSGRLPSQSGAPATLSSATV
jgi:Right handed beta helix region